MVSRSHMLDILDIYIYNVCKGSAQSCLQKCIGMKVGELNSSV